MTFFRGLLAGPGSLVLVVGGFLVAVLRAFPGAGGRAGNWDERKGRDGPDRSTGPLAVPLALFRAAIQAHYRVAA